MKVVTFFETAIDLPPGTELHRGQVDVLQVPGTGIANEVSYSVAERKIEIRGIGISGRRSAITLRVSV